MANISFGKYGYIVDPFNSIHDEAGNTVRGGYVRVCVSGTTSTAPTYDKFGTNANLNPEDIEIDLAGRCGTIIGALQNKYDVYVCDSSHDVYSPLFVVRGITPYGNITASGDVTLDGIKGVGSNNDNQVVVSTTIDGYAKIKLSDKMATSAELTSESSARAEADAALQTAINGKAAASHTHTKSDVSGLDAALSDRPKKVVVTDVADFESAQVGDLFFDEYDDTYLRKKIGGCEDTITSLNFELKGKADKSHTHTKSEVTDFAHTHSISDVNNLEESLEVLPSKNHITDVFGSSSAEAGDLYYNSQSAETLMKKKADGSNEATTLNDELKGKQDKLTAGTGITIENGVISAEVTGDVSKTDITDKTADTASVGDLVYEGGSLKKKTSGGNVSTSLNTEIKAKADDNAVVHNTGNETINGTKTFNNSLDLKSNINFAKNKALVWYNTNRSKCVFVQCNTSDYATNDIGITIPNKAGTLAIDGSCTADKATKDSDGNVIKDTYATKSESIKIVTATSEDEFPAVRDASTFYAIVEPTVSTQSEE